MIKACVQNHKYSECSPKKINAHNQPVVKDLYTSETYFVDFASGKSVDHDFVLY